MHGGCLTTSHQLVRIYVDGLSALCLNCGGKLLTRSSIQESQVTVSRDKSLYSYTSSLLNNDLQVEKSYHHAFS